MRLDVFELDNKLLPNLYSDDKINYAVTREDSIICSQINPYMTIAAYKENSLIGYLTLWPVSDETLNSLLNHKILESQINYKNDLISYKESNRNICWYVSGLGVDDKERGIKNDPTILQLLFNKSLDLAKATDIMNSMKGVVQRRTSNGN